MLVSIIIPVFNEEQYIEQVLAKVAGADIGPHKKEVIVVDDGSTDRTPAILVGLRDKYDFFLITHGKNRGKGAAIKTALPNVKGKAVLIQDADLEYDPADYKKLLTAFDMRTAPVVYGVRAFDESGASSYYWGGRLITAFLNLCLGSRVKDVNTCYKMIRTDILKHASLKSNGFSFCEEITVKILKAGFAIEEVPIRYRARSAREGKKLRFYHGVASFFTIIKYSFSNGQPIE